MPSKRSPLILLLLFLFAISGAIGFGAWQSREDFPKYNRFYFMAGYMADIEAFVQEQFPYGEQLENASVNLRMELGETKFDDIFIGDDILIEDIGQPDEEILLKNLNEVKAFCEANTVTPVSVLYLPTKFAIKQQELPDNAEYFAFNQKAFIEQSYAQLSGLATTVDAYSTLLANSDKYLFYRTDDELTGLGAYYVYAALIQRMGLSPLAQDQFTQQHVEHSYYGETYRSSSYKDVSPDIITLYHPNNHESCMVTHYNDYKYSYNTLYPSHKEGLDILLGGNTGDISIASGQKRQRSLLVFGDSSCIPLLPLLSAHYYQIRFIDFAHWNDTVREELNADHYDQILLSYSVDSMIHDASVSQLQRVRQLLEVPDQE